MRHPTATTAVLLASAAVALAGCSGINDPLNDPALAPTRPRATRSPNEVGIPRAGRPSRSALAAAAPTPTVAIERFAELYMNWSARTLADHQRHLAAIAIGEAATAEARAVAHTRSDYELRRGRIANEGRVVAIAPTRPPRLGAYIVVTRERTTGAGLYGQLAPAFHLTLVTVGHIADGWAVSQWHPQT